MSADIHQALEKFNARLTLHPDDPDALNTRGMLLEAQGCPDSALRDFDRALELRPDFADALNNRGNQYSRVGEFRAALACYERSLALAPTQPQVLYNRAMACLALGDWVRGFREYEHRWKIFPHEAARLNRLAPVWLGQCNIAGKTILLHHEQGYGDTLQFCRYASRVSQLGAQVILAVPCGLRTLMQTLPGRPRVVAEGDAVPQHDYCCSLMSLPLVFGTTPENVPSEVPYLSADPSAVEDWNRRLGPRSRPRIGFVWCGRRYPPINYARDMALELLEPLLALDADFVCLQTEVTQDEREWLAPYSNVSLYRESLRNFGDTAALIQSVDLVISVDTAVAHLAGALGKPVWLMNRYASCWRWLQHRPDSPWYPTLRLFRQKSYGDWAPVVREVVTAAELDFALAAHRNGELAIASRGYQRVLATDVSQPEALLLFGTALAQQGQFERAAQVLGKLSCEQPANAAAQNHLGNALLGLGRHEEALRCYDLAIALDPASSDVHFNRGVALMELGRSELALASLEQSLRINPENVNALNNLGNVLLDMGRYPQALEAYERATRLSPEFSAAWVNRGNLLRRLFRYEEALVCAERALSHDIRNAEAYGCRGAVLASSGRYEEALVDYARATDLKPTLADAVWNKAIAQLSRGEFREGWTHYEARWRVKTLGLTQRFSTRPRWSGKESLEGKVILLHAEQGYGDTIQFCRYATCVAARGARVILAVPEALRSVLKSLDGVESVIAQEPPPPFDYQCPLLSLPLAFATELSTIPAWSAYLRADPAAVSRWSDKLAPSSKVRVGLAWSGRPSHTNDPNRSIELNAFLPLLQCGAQCISLQKELRPGDAALLEGALGLQRCAEELGDFADTAALLSELDLVITVDTAIAHLAGALGKPVWILLPFVSDWRWMQERDTSPWYPSAKLFRQTVVGDWSGVLARVARELRSVVAKACR